jgi:hypothetical protein
MPTIRYAPELVEEAVFLAMTQGSSPDRALALAWQRERDPLYLLPPGPGRDRAFQAHASGWFTRLGLGAPIENALRRCPRVEAGLSALDVRRVARARDEGSEVFGPSGGNVGSSCRMVFGLRPQRFLDLASVEELALREFLHADDMLDPEFGFDPDARPGGECEPARAELVCDRFRMLWRTRVSGRLARRTGARASPPDPEAPFLRAFGPQADPAAVKALFREVWSGSLASYDALVERASASTESPS